MTTPIRVLLVDDDALALAGLESLLGQAGDLEIVGTCSGGAQVAGAIRDHRPDVVVCDVRMPDVDGIEVVTTLKDSGPRFLMMTAFDDEGAVLQAIAAGAAAFMLKGDDPIHILHAVRSVAAGEGQFSPRVAKQISHWVRDDKNAVERRAAVSSLSSLAARELEVAVEVAHGLTDAEIAIKLHISQSTVKSTLATVRTKVGARTRVDVAVTVTFAGLY